MRYVQAGFVGEGPTDAQFLAPLVRRLLEEHLLASARSDFLVPDPVVIRPGQRWGNDPHAVLAELEEEAAYLDLLLYHTDAAGAVDDAYSQRVEVVSARSRVPVVGVVPKREMEAWALADASALCGVLGVERAQAVVPAHFTPRRVESITDPKVAMHDFIESIPGRRFTSPDPELTLFGALALTVDLDVLVQVPQAKRLVDDLAAVTHAQGWLV